MSPRIDWLRLTVWSALGLYSLAFIGLALVGALYLAGVVA